MAKTKPRDVFAQVPKASKTLRRMYPDDRSVVLSNAVRAFIKTLVEECDRWSSLQRPSKKEARKALDEIKKELKQAGWRLP